VKNNAKNYNNSPYCNGENPLFHKIPVYLAIKRVNRIDNLTK